MSSSKMLLADLEEVEHMLKFKLSSVLCYIVTLCFLTYKGPFNYIRTSWNILLYVTGITDMNVIAFTWVVVSKSSSHYSEETAGREYFFIFLLV